MPVPPNFNTYTHRLGFLCLASQRNGQKNKQTNKQTNSASQLRGEQTPTPQIFRVCRGGCTLHKHYVGPTPFYGARAENPQKSPFCHEANEYMLPQRRHKKTKKQLCLILANVRSRTLTPQCFVIENFFRIFISYLYFSFSYS